MPKSKKGIESPLPQKLSRADWMKKYQRFDISTVEIKRPGAVGRFLKSDWRLCRIGSIWDRDEEYHVYCMADAIRLFVETREANPDSVTLAVTPIWVFVRSGDRISASSNNDVRRRAERNFMRFLVEAVKGGTNV